MEVVGVAALIFLFWLTYQATAGPNRLPDKIPTHFDLAGHPNAWGPTAYLYLLPVLGLVLYLAMTVVARFPSAFNFPVRVTPQNRAALEQIGQQLVAWLKVQLVCIFDWIQASTIAAARHESNDLSPWLMPLTLLVVFGTIGWHIAAMIRAGRSGAGTQG